MVVEEGEEKREDAVEEEAKGDSLVVSTLASAVVMEAVAVSRSSRLASLTERVPPVVVLLLGLFPFLPF